MTVKELMKRLKEHAKQHGDDAEVYMAPAPSDEHHNNFGVNDVIQVATAGVAAGVEVESDELPTQHHIDVSDGQEIAENALVLYPY